MCWCDPFTRIRSPVCVIRWPQMAQRRNLPPWQTSLSRTSVSSSPAGASLFRHFVADERGFPEKRHGEEGNDEPETLLFPCFCRPFWRLWLPLRVKITPTFRLSSIHRQPLISWRLKRFDPMSIRPPRVSKSPLYCTRPRASGSLEIFLVSKRKGPCSQTWPLLQVSPESFLDLERTSCLQETLLTGRSSQDS